MKYKYTEHENYEHFASGRVLHGYKGAPNYPVRIASEVFSRCRSYLNNKFNIVLYDPCCGSGYGLTVIGLLHQDCISSIFASDINTNVLEIANKNLSLLAYDGIESRRVQILEDYRLYNKPSHKEALESVEYLKGFIKQKNEKIKTNCFHANIYNHKFFTSLSFKADIIFMDVPYGDLVHWTEGTSQSNNILNNVSNVLAFGGVVAISHNKKQNFASDNFNRIERIRIGKRIIDIFRMKWTQK